MKLKNSISLRAEYTLLISLVITGMIGLTLLLNALFLEPYYYARKQKAVVRVVNTLTDAAKDGLIEAGDFDESFIRYCGMNNINLIVIDVDSEILFTTRDDAQMLARLWGNIFSPPGFSNSNVERVIKKDDTSVLQIVTRKRSGLRYMEMWGDLQNGELYLVQSAMDSVRTAADIANRLLLIVGFFVMLIGLFIAAWFSRQVTMPLKILTDISTQMKDLRFEEKYIPLGHREMDELGCNINELSEELERTVSELKTANYELMQDIEVKTESEKRQREFLANVSHELKTPIALIRGYAEGLTEGVNDDPESRAYYCEVISDEAEKMNGIVKRLMTLNQLESGEEPMTFERFDLAEMLQNIVKSADILTKSVSARVILSAAAPLYVWADQFMTEEVIQNYFQNAIHHVEGDRVIEIRAEAAPEKEKKIRVSVFNTGKPIPEESIDRIWDKFYKADKARTREYGGSGVGLSIVKAIMEAMHEEYGVTNYDNGVSFWFELEQA